MKWFLDLPMGGKLGLGFGVMIALLVGGLLTGYVNTAAMYESQKTLFDRDVTIVADLLELKADQNRLRAQVLEMSLRSTKAEQDAVEREIRSRQPEIDSLLQRLAELGRGDPKFVRRLEELKSNIAAYRQARDRQIALIYEGKVDEARQLGVGVQDERYEKIRGNVAL